MEALINKRNIMDKMPEQVPRPSQENEKAISPELAETLARLRKKGYLDTSFEGKEVHELATRSLSKVEALAEYKKSGGEAWVWSELEKNMSYSTPKAESLDVMILNFRKSIGSDEAVAEMDALGLRPLTYEELIQYGTTYPSHQKQKGLVALGNKYTLGVYVYAPVLTFGSDLRMLVPYLWGTIGRVLSALPWSRSWGNGWFFGDYRFLVVRK